MQVTLTYEIKVTRGNQVDRSRFSRTLSPTECYTATLQAATGGATVDTSHMAVGDTLILVNRDDSILVTARLTRTTGLVSWKAGDLELVNDSLVPTLATVSALETLTNGDFNDQGWEPGMFARLVGTQSSNDGSYGVAQVTAQGAISNNQLDLFRPAWTTEGEEALPVVTHKDTMLDVALPAGSQQVVDNMYPGDQIVLTSASGTPTVDVILVGS